MLERAAIAYSLAQEGPSAAGPIAASELVEADAAVRREIDRLRAKGSGPEIVQVLRDAADHPMFRGHDRRPWEAFVASLLNSGQSEVATTAPRPSSASRQSRGESARKLTGVAVLAVLALGALFAVRWITTSLLGQDDVVVGQCYDYAKALSGGFDELPCSDFDAAEVFAVGSTAEVVSACPNVVGFAVVEGSSESFCLGPPSLIFNSGVESASTAISDEAAGSNGQVRFIPHEWPTSHVGEISPDGDSLAYIEEGDRVCWVRIGGSGTPQCSPDLGQIGYVSWTADGSHVIAATDLLTLRGRPDVVLIGRDGSLVRVGDTGREQEGLTESPSSFEYFEYQPAPTVGERIAMIRQFATRLEIVEVGPGQEVFLAEGPPEVTGVRVLQRSSHVVATFEQLSASDPPWTALYDKESGTWLQLESSWTDRSYILLSTGGPNSSTIVTADLYSIGEARSDAFRDNEVLFQIHQLDDHSPTPIWRPEHQVQAVALSPDGARIAVVWDRLDWQPGQDGRYSVTFEAVDRLASGDEVWRDIPLPSAEAATVLSTNRGEQRVRFVNDGSLAVLGDSGVWIVQDEE